jgi:hypothetical protein
MAKRSINIRAIISEAKGFGGQAFPAQAHTSLAKKSINRYSGNNNNDSKKSNTSNQGPLCCYGCRGPHPWSLLGNSIHMIKCPNAGNPGIHKNTKKVIYPIRSKSKKKQQDFMKHKNLATKNFSKFDDASKERIWQQVFTSVSMAPSKTASIALLITGVTGGTTTPFPGIEKVAPNASSSCMTPKFSTPTSTALCSQFPFNL